MDDLATTIRDALRGDDFGDGPRKNPRNYSHSRAERFNILVNQFGFEPHVASRLNQEFMDVTPSEEVALIARYLGRGALAYYEAVSE